MMKNIKKIVGVLALVFSLSLVGCGKTEVSTSNNDEKGEKVHLEMLQFKPELFDALDRAITIYTKEHPNVSINVTISGDSGQALLAKMQSDNPPTIFNISGVAEVQKWEEKLDDLSKEPWVSHAVDGLLDQVTKDGKIYGLPYGIEGYGYIYNSDIFDTAGIDIANAKTFDEVKNAVDALDKKIKNGELKKDFPNLEAVFEVPGKETWVLGQHTADFALSPEFNGPKGAYNAKTVKFTHKDILKKLIDFQTDYTTNYNNKANLNSVDYTMVLDNGISVERVAMVQQGNWIYPAVKNIDEEVAKNLRLLPVPVDNSGDNKIPIGVPMYWAINKESSDLERETAKDFLNWLYQSDEGKNIIVNEFFFIPPFTNYDGINAVDPLSQDIQKLSESGKTYPWSFPGYPPGWAMEILGPEIQRYLSGDATFDDAIEQAKKGWKNN